MRAGSALIFSLLLATTFQTGCTQDVKWSTVLHAVRVEYEDVQHITTDSLKQRLDQSATSGVTLLDTRTRGEFNVSHLRGAVRVDPDEEEFSSLDSLDRATPIVTYCSVGYRSAAVARRLGELGFTNVSNLEGSIFKWANEDLPVYRGDEIVTEVHPFDRLWGQLLVKDRRAYTPRD